MSIEVGGLNTLLPVATAAEKEDRAMTEDQREVQGVTVDRFVYWFGLVVLCSAAGLGLGVVAGWLIDHANPLGV